jgi:pyruvate kinase
LIRIQAAPWRECCCNAANSRSTAILDHSSAATAVVTGGRISDPRGVNVPNVVLPLSPITEKDRRVLGVVSKKVVQPDPG